MKQAKNFWRTLLSLTILAALCGSFAFPAVDVHAAPGQGSLACNLLMAQWTFDQAPPPSATTPAPSTANVAASASESGVNGIQLQPTGSHSGNAWSGTGWSQTATPGPYYEFDVSTVAYTGISLSFWSSRPNTGPASVSVQYSTDGTNFTPFNIYPVSTSVTQTAIDLSSVTLLDNNPNSKFRIYGINATGASGSLRIDDVTFTGCQPATATPTATDTGTPTPTGTAPAVRSVIINEVAWGGTQASSSDEWFELYNATGTNINLNGWHLTADDGSPDIALSGTITAADPYFVFARNPAVFNDLAPDKTYSGGLGNNGETLYLLDPNGNQVDTANLDGGTWDAGTGSPTFASMERQGNVADTPTAWVTYGGTVPVAHDRANNPINGTPGQGNWALTITPTPTPTTTGTATPTGTATKTGTPTTGSPRVIISEVAWSGTAANSNDEWIELYNPSSSPIDITGWHLYGDDNTINKVGTPNITLSGTIPANDFFLLERDEKATDIPANQVSSTIDLLNTGERLYLKDSAGNTIDTANLDGGSWPAGTATTTTTSPPAYASMERVGTTGNQWVTYNDVVDFAHNRNGGFVKGTPHDNNWIWTASITTITSDSPDPSVVNQNVNVVVTVLGGLTTPTGTVAITGANTNCTLTLSNGTGSCQVRFTSVGTKTITATYTSTSGLPRSNDTESHQVAASGTVFSTPTPAPPPPPPQLVVINEFVPRPGHDWNGDGVVNVGDEYIELLNHGTVDVNLSGYRLDDEVNVGSNPYSLPAKVLKPGERIAFYGSETGLLLGDGGDGVRLLKPNGQLMDAYNYTVVRYPDQSYCRLPDNGGADDWNQNCFPTPGFQNSLSGNIAVPSGSIGQESLCPIADTLPFDFVRAECDPFGNNIWRPEFWDRTGWYNEKYLPIIDGKWPIFAD
jgi:hypothetical protein